MNCSAYTYYVIRCGQLLWVIHELADLFNLDENKANNLLLLQYL